jgi:hypothetical protein
MSDIGLAHCLVWGSGSFTRDCCRVALSSAGALSHETAEDPNPSLGDLIKDMSRNNIMPCHFILSDDTSIFTGIMRSLNIKDQTARSVNKEVGYNK